MDSTPNRKPKTGSRLARNGRDPSPEDMFGCYDNSTTPVQSRNMNVYDEYSPIFLQCTQEALENQDVVWDWNSPQSKPKQSKLKQKRLPISNSPILPSKKILSANHLKVSDKIRSQLEALKNQLESEVNLAKQKTTKENPQPDPEDLKDLEDFFNDDSIEEELIMQSQRVENLFSAELKPGACDTNTKDENANKSVTSEFRKVKSDNHLNESHSMTTFKTKSVSSNGLYVSPKHRRMGASTSSCRMTNVQLNASLNDSFELALQSIKETEFECEKRQEKSPNGMFGSSDSIENVGLSVKEIIEKNRLEALAKLKAKKQQQKALPSTTTTTTTTVATETTKLAHLEESPIECSLGEIEQKRQQALVKLQTKKTATTIIETPMPPPLEESPIKCSPEEIEQKRLQALAKLQAKKKQEIIEKNRKEALKRLEMNKKKRAMMMKNIMS